MEPSELDRLRAQIGELFDRVGRLEAQQLQAPTSPPSTVGTADTHELSSFTQPARPSLESRIGSQWFNRIGIVALLIGAAWFLKYAIDRSWLGPDARVVIGLLAGLGLIAWSERFRQGGYPVFSFSLKAVGTGVLYLSLWASFSLFHLLAYPASFAGMVLVTAGNVLMCWRQRSEVLAGFAAVGGFLTPALLGSQQVSVPTLGSYLLLLNLALFGLMLHRRWTSLLLAAFSGTAAYLLPMAWRPPDRQQSAALWLIAFFFAIFSVAPLAASRFRQASGAKVGIPVTLLNAGLGLFELWRLALACSLATRWLGTWLAAWFALLLLAARSVAFKQSEDSAVQSALVALVIAFTTLGIYTGLPSGGIVAGWAIEAGVLLLFAVRTRAAQEVVVLRSPAPAGFLLVAAALYLIGSSLVGDFRESAPVLLNSRSALFLLLIATAIFAVRLAARQHRAHRSNATQWARAGSAAALLASVLLLLDGLLEIHAYWRGFGGTAEQFWYSAWTAFLGVGLLVFGFRVRWAFLRWQALALLTLAVAKVFVIDTRALSQGFRILSFLGLGVLLLCVSFIYQRDLLHLRGKEHEG